MKVHRFIGDWDLSKKQLLLTEAKLVHQLFSVLKIKVGEHLVLSNGAGAEVEALVIKANPKQYLVELTANRDGVILARQIILYAAVLKKENFEWIAQKVTEVGVSRIVPIITARTVKLNLNLERLAKIVQEASEQAGRSSVPKIGRPITFTESLKESQPNDLNIFYNHGGLAIKELQNRITRAKRIGVYIGPEGGWTQGEVDSAKAAKMEIASLGATTLRGETAAIVGVWAVCG